MVRSFLKFNLYQTYDIPASNQEWIDSVGEMT